MSGNSAPEARNAQLVREVRAIHEVTIPIANESRLETKVA